MQPKESRCAHGDRRSRARARRTARLPQARSCAASLPVRVSVHLRADVVSEQLLNTSFNIGSLTAVVVSGDPVSGEVNPQNVVDGTRASAPPTRLTGARAHACDEYSRGRGAFTLKTRREEKKREWSRGARRVARPGSRAAGTTAESTSKAQSERTPSVGAGLNIWPRGLRR